MALESTTGYVVAATVTLLTNLTVALLIAYLNHKNVTNTTKRWKQIVAGMWTGFFILMAIEVVVALVLAYFGRMTFIDFMLFGQYLAPLIANILEFLANAL